MGSAIHYLPFTYSSFFIGSIALMGFPFLTGFYSKDLIIETAFGGGNYEISSYFSFWLSLFTAFLTAFYSTRLLYYTFVSSPFSPSDRPSFSEPPAARRAAGGLVFSFSRTSPAVTAVSNNNKLPLANAPHESNIYMSLPLFILSFFSLFFGYLAKDLFVGIGTPIFSSPNNFDFEFLDPLVRLYPFLFSSLGVLTAFYIFSNRKFSYPLNYGANWLNNLYWFFNSKWFFDTIYSYLTGFFLIFAYLIPLKSFDRGFIELLGPTGLSKFSTNYWLSASLNYQTGFINDMIFGILSVSTAMLIIILGPTGTLIGTLVGSSSFKIISFLAPWFLSYGLSTKSEESIN
jgi:NADH-ubiquinone oxidoreductase chain 5